MRYTLFRGLHNNNIIRTPYWLNGFVPLAFQLEDPDLISMVSLPCLSGACIVCIWFQVHKYISYILVHQTADGWWGLDDIKDGNAYWSKYPMLFTLRQYYEATQNAIVVSAMHHFIKAAHSRMFTTPFGVTW